MAELKVNGEIHALDIDPDTPLLWALRDHLHLRGAKYACGIGVCGACTVLVDGRAESACMLSVAQVGGRAVTTIEGLTREHDPVQQAWLALQVPQCGYCVPGMIMASIALLREKPAPTEADIEAAMINICRCGTYNRVRAAILAAAGRVVRSGD